MHVPEVQVLIHINGVEITSEVGQGLHPFDILIPDNLLVASEEPQRIMIAGDEWDYDQQPAIMRDGDTVRWEWEDDASHPLGRSRAGRPQGAGSAQHRPSHLAGVLLLHRSTLYRSPASGRAWVDPRTRPLTIRDSRRDRAPPTGVPPKSEPVSVRIAVHASRPGAGSIQSRRTTHSGAPAELAKAPRWPRISSPRRARDRSDWRWWSHGPPWTSSPLHCAGRSRSSGSRSHSAHPVTRRWP